MRILNKHWGDPVWSKVIASTIIATSTGIATYFLDLWPIISSLLVNSYGLFFASTNIPNYFLVLLVTLCLPTTVIGIFLLKTILFSKGSKQPIWKNYTSDNYFGVKWRWNYFDSGKIYDLHSFCPHCDFQIFPTDIAAYNFINHIAFYCDSCGKNLGEFEETQSSLENKTERFIQQKLRNKTWPA